eukprot:CAMPEP_0119034784 /NCGR_PEP_ID=MMETSP1177-20130426/1798_1 /TAXON_ID=2985 /ORGANISM="Ochromonas sp, Strain CCMP1899" /LENGTH=221 /DNA_ID=CAMNT_0006992487 /DNA_START=98 /DNA_END=763 /DNA_ORIENTATION=-
MVMSNNDNYDLFPQEASGRNSVFKSLMSALVVVPTLTAAGTIALAAAPSEEKYLDSLATLLTCQKVLENVDNYIEVQAYDNARTNVNYLLNQLFLEKKVQQLIQQSLDFSEDPDAIDVAQEAGNRVSNTAIQLDSTLYTCNFIPGDDDGLVPPAAEKYRKQCFDFLKQLRGELELLLKVGSPPQIAKAQVKAGVTIKALPPVLFKKKEMLVKKGADNGMGN